DWEFVTLRRPMDESAASFFPEQIIIEILSRIPVKSLLRFRSVSKSWLRLISTSYFIGAHLEKSIDDAGLSKHILLFTDCLSGFELKRCSVKSLMSDSSSVENDFDYPGKYFFRTISVVGSVQGLVCIAGDEDHVFLWNPATRRSHKLPNLVIDLPKGFYYIWGFGCDHRHDYKIVGLFCWIGVSGWYESVVMIHSLKSDSWKRIQDFKHGIPLDNTGKFAHGKLHYPTTGGRIGRWTIVSLDLDTETYATVEQPRCWDDECESSLGLLGGSICVLRNDMKSVVDVWLLREYDMADSWTKLFSISSIRNPRKFLHSTPLFVLPNGEILLFLGAHFVAYDPKTNSLRHRRHPDHLTQFFEADIYVESLVSP
ncbi:hypothetical protein M569_01365, partial [Genlisea aurea]